MSAYEDRLAEHDWDQSYPAAIHEAGHAVVAMEMGWTPKGIQSDAFGGLVIISMPKEEQGGRKECLVKMAGRLAEARLAPHMRDFSDEVEVITDDRLSDWEDEEEGEEYESDHLAIARYLSTRDDPQAEIDTMAKEADEILDKRWGEVLDLAKSLNA